MKAFITINQKAFFEISQHKKTKLDLIDATIFEYIYKFSLSNKVQKKIVKSKGKEKLFIWVAYQKIIDDNPLLNITSKKAIELRLNKLAKIGLIEKKTDKKLGNKTFFNITDYAFSLVIENTNLSNQDSKPLVSTVTNLSKQSSEPLSKHGYYNRELYNRELDRKLEYNKEKNLKKENVPLLNLKPEKVDNEVWEDFVKARRLKKAIITQRVISGILKEIKQTKLSINKGFEMIVDRGWVSFKAEWILKKEKKFYSSVYAKNRAEAEEREDDDLPF